MALDIREIIRLTTNISAAGLGTANFGSAMFFCPESEKPAGESVDTYKTYNITSLASDFASTTETYKAIYNKWFSSAPSMPSIKIWFVNSLDADWTTTLNKARNATWWFWSFFDAATYADVATAVPDIAAWCETNKSLFMNCQTGTEAAKIRDENDASDIATTLTTSGYRFSSTFAHATDPYVGIAAAKWLARVNYSGTNTVTDVDFKTLAGVVSEDLPVSEYAAMKQDTKKCGFYTTIQLQGETDVGVIQNTWSHSSFGEYLDDVVNVEAISNAVNVAAYNFLRGQKTKAPQTSKGQAGLIRSIEQVGTQFVNNGYLGERNYVDPDTGEDAFTKTGFVMLSKPEDILSLSPTDRAARKSAVIRYRLFPSGSIRVVEIEQTIYNQ
ncbi:MAG: DUF3383 family protein [Reinekea sp.]|nr:DUF3383 family protein [Reinekea sp.]